MSGKPYYQEKQFTGLSDRGPIPEGNWVIKQGDLEAWDDVDGKGIPLKNRYNDWRRNGESWGDFRIKIEPVKGTDTQGRLGMYLHGGDVPGSAGCIDLTENMNDFINYFSEYGKDMVIKVRYPKDKWR